MSEVELWEKSCLGVNRWKMCFFSVYYYALCSESTTVRLMNMYFDLYVGSSYMIQVVFCPYIYVVGETCDMTVAEFLLQAGS